MQCTPDVFYPMPSHLKNTSFNKYVRNTSYALDTVLGFGAKSVDETDKNPYPLGACVLLEKKMNKIHMQNYTIRGGNLVSEMEKRKQGQPRVAKEGLTMLS